MNHGARQAPVLEGCPRKDVSARGTGVHDMHRASGLRLDQARNTFSRIHRVRGRGRLVDERAGRLAHLGAADDLVDKRRTAWTKQSAGPYNEHGILDCWTACSPASLVSP